MKKIPVAIDITFLIRNAAFDPKNYTCPAAVRIKEYRAMSLRAWNAAYDDAPWLEAAVAQYETSVRTAIAPHIEFERDLRSSLALKLKVSDKNLAFWPTTPIAEWSIRELATVLMLEISSALIYKTSGDPMMSWCNPHEPTMFVAGEFQQDDIDIVHEKVYLVLNPDGIQ